MFTQECVWLSWHFSCLLLLWLHDEPAIFIAQLCVLFYRFSLRMRKISMRREECLSTYSLQSPPVPPPESCGPLPPPTLGGTPEHPPQTHCTALHWIALYCTSLYNTALHWIALHCTSLYNTALHCSHLNLCPYTASRVMNSADVNSTQTDAEREMWGRHNNN